MFRIRQILNEKGLSAKALAEKMNVTQQYISSIITERGSASVSVLKSIAKELDVPLASLFDDYNKDNNVSTNDVVCPHCGKKISIEIKIKE